MRNDVASLAAVAIVVMLAACSSARSTETDHGEAELRTLDASEVDPTPLRVGERDRQLYVAGASFRALKFTARQGMRARATVRGGPGQDPEAWIVGSTFRTIAQNDNASSDAPDAVVETDLPHSGDYYVVVRDVNLAAGTFQVGLEAVYAPVGAPCAMPNLIQDQTCGRAGTQSRLCLSDERVWSSWGMCFDEVPEDQYCDPAATYQDEACGRCGKQKRKCTSGSVFATSACVEPATAECVANELTFVEGLGCVTGGRYRSCTASCSRGAVGECIDPGHGGTGPGEITISGYPAETVTGSFVVTAADTADLPAAAQCPTYMSGQKGPHRFVAIRNTTLAPHEVELEISRPGGAEVWNAANVWAAFYPGDTQPLDRTQCVGEIAYGVRPLVVKKIPPMSTLMVDLLSDQRSDLPFVVNARTRFAE